MASQPSTSSQANNVFDEQIEIFEELVEKSVQELNKWFHEKMNVGGEWYQKMIQIVEKEGMEEGEEKWFCAEEYHAKDREWSRKRGLCLRHPITFEKVISWWGKMMFGRNWYEHMDWCVNMGIFIDIKDDMISFCVKCKSNEEILTEQSMIPTQDR